MDSESYKTSLSNEDISDRLSKLDSISSPEWDVLISLMRDVKMAGYQEAYDLGLSACSLLLKYLFGFKLGHLIILLNTPIYLLALVYDKSFFINGLLGMFITSIVIDLLLPLNGIVHLPIIISAVLGGILIGLGVGLLLRHDISPGGIDLLALLLSKALKN